MFGSRYIPDRMIMGFEAASAQEQSSPTPQSNQLRVSKPHSSTELNDAAEATPSDCMGPPLLRPASTQSPLSSTAVLRIPRLRRPGSSAVLIPPPSPSPPSNHPLPPTVSGRTRLTREDPIQLVTCRCDVSEDDATVLRGVFWAKVGIEFQE